jgi:hypothetical protein
MVGCAVVGGLPQWRKPMRTALPTRIAGIVLTAGAALLMSACTYVERTPPAPQQPATLVVPQASPTVVAPSAPPPTVTVRPSY